jgi:hypothetical protein
MMGVQLRKIQRINTKTKDTKKESSAQRMRFGQE